MSESAPTQGYWGGEWHNGTGNKTFQVFDPSNGKVLAEVADCTTEDAKLAVAAASEAFKTWSKSNVKERAAILLKIRDELVKNKDQIAKILTQENGKPYKEAQAEVLFAGTFFEWFAEEARRQYGEVIPSPNSHRRITIRQPAGVAALITPWNFPIGMMGRKVAAALAAGCTCVVKPAEDTPLVALVFAKICHNIGVPKGVVNVLPCSRESVPQVGSFLAKSKDIAALSFTGSVEVGQLLYSLCGSTVKKIGLELGGNAPFIVFPSADLKKAVSGTMDAKFRNTGQTCASANRIFVHESIHDQYVEMLSAKMDASIKVGSGLEAGVNYGPIINQKQLEKLKGIVNKSLDMGAKVVRGAKPLGGLFYAPTLLTEVTTEMPVAKEEIFGPVAAVIKFTSEDQVIALANDTDRGLAGYFYTNDLNQSWRMAASLEYGIVGVNEGLISTCEAPFGGMKTSGIGKEGSRHGLDDYSHIKYVCFGNIV